MPNLVTHIAFAWAGIRPFRRLTRWIPFFLIGAVLPDISPAIYIPLLDFLGGRFPGIDPQAVIWYFQPWHTPFGALFFCAAAGLLLSADFWRGFAALTAGAFSHFLLDAFQKHMGMHLLLAYPFHFGNFNFSLWYSDAAVFHVLTAISSCLLLVFFLKERRRIPPDRLHLSRVRVTGAVLLLGAVILLPFLTREAFYNADFHSLTFFRDPASREGTELSLCTTEVVSDRPWTLIELGRRIPFIPHPDMEVRIGDRISVVGLYQDGRIVVERWHLHRGFSAKIVLSLLGLVVLVLVIFLPRKGGD